MAGLVRIEDYRASMRVRSGREPGRQRALPELMPSSSSERRTVLALLVSVVALLAFAGNAFAATTVNITTQPGSAGTDGLQHTTTRGSSFAFTATGTLPGDPMTVTCSLDGVV